MRRLWLHLLVLVAAALAGSAYVPEVRGRGLEWQQAEVPAAAAGPVPQAPPEPPPTRHLSEVIEGGVLIVVSLPAQKMHVFRNGTLWRSVPVSTGRRRKETPQGVFAILQKKRYHRSNLYSNAPMPFMQRLTWDGIAIHAGRLPGYPASHGCIRVPYAFAEALYRITRPSTTAVIVTGESLVSEAEALALARRTDALVPIHPEVLRREQALLARAAEPVPPRPPAARSIAMPPDPAREAAAMPPAPGRQQTIQLAAASSSQDARRHWDALADQRPELRDMQVAIIPAVVKGIQYYRLRASAPDAHARCRTLRSAGIACFPVG